MAVGDLSFAFDSSKGQTPQSIAAKRALAEAILGNNTHAPHDIGEGLNAIGQAILFRKLMKGADNAEANGTAAAAGQVAGLFPQPFPAAPGSTSPGSQAATQPAAPSPIAASGDTSALSAAISDPAALARLPAGMRNNNPGNIKFVGQNVPGIVGPSQNTDQGDPQAVFDSPESGMRAMYGLLQRKYSGGKITANDIIAGQGGWTPGNFQAAANVARNAGLQADQDINFNDPQAAARFMRGLMLQEHGNASKLYPDSLIQSAIGGQPSTPPAVSAVNALAAGSAPAPALPPPRTIQDRPIAQGPDPTTLPAMAGGNSDVIDPNSQQQGPSVQQLVQASANPWIQRSYGPVVNALLEQKMKQGDPGYALDLTKKRMDIQLQQQQLGGSFRGDSMDAQAWNILQTRDPSSREYQTAYSIVSQPKTQMAQTANGLVPVQVPPNLPAWLKAPGDAGGPSMAPAGAAPGATPPASPGVTPSSAPASPATAGAPLPGTKQPPTEMQARNGAIGKILLNEVPTLGANFKALSDPKGQFLNALPGGIGNAWQSPQYQQAANAVKASVANVLYSLSGASSNPGEVLNQIGILTPAFGDAPATIDGKLQRFKTYVRAISSEANDPVLTNNVETAISQMDAPAAPPSGQAAAPAAGPRPRATNPQTGQSVEWDGTKWAPAQ